MRRWTLFGLIVLCMLALSVPARAQGFGKIVGTVSDPSGAVIPNAKVTAIEAGKGFSRTASTDAIARRVFQHFQSRELFERRRHRASGFEFCQGEFYVIVWGHYDDDRPADRTTRPEGDLLVPGPASGVLVSHLSFDEWSNVLKPDPFANDRRCGLGGLTNPGYLTAGD